MTSALGGRVGVAKNMTKYDEGEGGSGILTSYLEAEKAISILINVPNFQNSQPFQTNIHCSTAFLSHPGNVLDSNDALIWLHVCKQNAGFRTQCWGGGGWLEIWRLQYTGGVRKYDQFWQGEGGGQKSRKFSRRHLYMPPNTNLEYYVCLSLS